MLRRRARGVDDQDNAAVGQYARAANAGDARKLRPDVLHNHLAVAEKLIDMDRDALVTAAHQEHRVVVLDVRWGALPDELAQVVQRVVAPLELDYALLVERDQRIDLDAQH